LKHKLTWLRTALISLAVLACGIAVARHLMKTRPKAMRRERAVAATLVEVISATPRSETVFVVERGTVIPARELELTPEVSGRIIWQSPNLVPGGLFDEQDEILKIDRGDYEAALKLKQSQHEEATFNLKVEEGQQAIAKRDWEMLGNELELTETRRELALREPHLSKARAAVEAAHSAAERAQYDLDRTTIAAPFNAIIKEEFAEKEQLLTPQTKIATLIGTDHFWVQVSVPVDRLSWIDLPDEEGKNGASAKVIQELASDGKIEKAGQVIRLLGDLDPVGRRARVLVEVDDPLGLKAGGKKNSDRLLLGAYVRVEIEGRQLDEVFVLPSTAVHDGDRVWIMNEKDQLEVREATVAWRRTDSVLIQDGIKPGEEVVVSRIPTPIPGMLLRTVSDETEGAPDGR
jgi:RND family efflux transporter MFP subunit